MTVTVQWVTPDVDAMIARIARVSNPATQGSRSIEGLLRYMMRNGHVSPFEMAHACLEIETTRDIGRQILRHRSFSFQEFCVAADTEITLELPGTSKRSAYKRTIEHLYKLQESGKKLPAAVRVFDETTRTFVRAGIREVFKTGVKPVFRLTLANGRILDCTKEHKLLTTRGFLPLEDAVGLRMVGSTAAMTKADVSVACNGVPAHRDAQWLASAKQRAIASGTGLAGIAVEAGVTTHAIRKALKRHDLQFSKREVAQYNPIWNKGLRGYSRPRHSPETIEKMRASAKRGAASNLWRGGADRSERRKIADWCSAHRSEFLRAADYKCRRCGSTTLLELHHALTVAERPDLAYDKSNIEVLCRTCHRDHHRTAGHAKTWREHSRGNTLTLHWSAVEKVECLGEQMTYDMEVDHQSHNYVANGIVTHNSQRYQTAAVLPVAPPREARMQDKTNRQSSLPCDDRDVQTGWLAQQERIQSQCRAAYEWALAHGIAKEQARALLPEGLTTTRMYMVGSFRSWIHYLQQRLYPSTQAEHREIAEQVRDVLEVYAPITMRAFFERSETRRWGHA